MTTSTTDNPSLSLVSSSSLLLSSLSSLSSSRKRQREGERQREGQRERKSTVSVGSSSNINDNNDNDNSSKMLPSSLSIEDDDEDNDNESDKNIPINDTATTNTTNVAVATNDAEAADDEADDEATGAEDMMVVSGLRLEAIFHPKFDNEKRTQKQNQNKPLNKKGRNNKNSKEKRRNDGTENNDNDNDDTDTRRAMLRKLNGCYSSSSSSNSNGNNNDYNTKDEKEEGGRSDSAQGGSSHSHSNISHSTVAHSTVAISGEGRGGGARSGSGSGRSGETIGKGIIMAERDTDTGGEKVTERGGSDGGGYLEVSLKHSGSLVLWSGKQSYYSKNSAGNEFTRTAEILLRQYLYQIQQQQQQQQQQTQNKKNEKNHEDDATADDDNEYLYHACSNYITKHRFTIAFEVVTGHLGLGDHGQIPTHDYVVVTAIADRHNESFFSTAQVLHFCHTYHLPHNDIWIFTNNSSAASSSSTSATVSSSLTSAQQLFQLYDTTLKETGETPQTIQGLTTISDLYIPSPVPHLTYQGTICEGFIVRYVEADMESDNTTTTTPITTTMQQLAQTAVQNNNNRVNDTDRNDTNADADVDADVDPVLTTDLRDLYQSLVVSCNNKNEKVKENEVVSTFARQRQRAELFSETLRQLLVVKSSSEKKKKRNNNNKDRMTTRFDLKKLNEQEKIKVQEEVDMTTYHLPSLAQKLLRQLSSANQKKEVHHQQQQQQQQQQQEKETIRIATLLQTLDDLTKNTKNVTYTWFEKQQEKNQEEEKDDDDDDDDDDEDEDDDDHGGGGNQEQQRRRQRRRQQQQRRRRLYCMIHVHNDATFFKFQKRQPPNEMQLFRGFCVEVVLSLVASSKTSTANTSASTSVVPTLPSSSNNKKKMKMNNTAMIATATANADATPPSPSPPPPPLMLKMKLLPYMVRTFICRNLLRTIENNNNNGNNGGGGGPEEFARIAAGLLEKWNISRQGQARWMSFLRGWAVYVVHVQQVRKEEQDKTHTHTHNHKHKRRPEELLGPLTNFSYLQHLEYYTKLYHNEDSEDNGTLKKMITSAAATAATSTLRTLSVPLSSSPEWNTFVCVVSQSTEVALAIAEYLAERLCNSNHGSSSDDNEEDNTGTCPRRSGNGSGNGGGGGGGGGESSGVTTTKMTVCSLGEATKYRRTKTCIAYATITDLTKGIKQFLCKKVCKHSLFVLYGSDPSEITITPEIPVAAATTNATTTTTTTTTTTIATTMDQEDKGHKDNDGDGDDSKSSSSWLAISSNGERKKIVNLWKAWKKFPCAKRLALSRATFGFEPRLEDSTVAVINRTTTTATNNEVNNTIEEIRVLGRVVMEQESRKQSKLPTQSGILLFFPGIPGCGKSSLLHTMETTLQKELTSQKKREKEEDALYDKKMYVKEGDKMGKNFWDVIGDLLSSDDHDHDANDPDTNEHGPVVAALVIADKNAPPASWPRVGQICNDSHSLPLPVLLDSTVLETTTIEGLIQPDGVVVPHSSHCYPFSLNFLAVCLARVLSRPAGEHSGKLDSGSPVAGMIVVQFYSFYRYVSADTFLDKLDGKLESTAQASSSSSSTTSLTPIELPFLKASTQNRELPEDLQQLLVETLQLRQGHDKNKKYKVKKDDPQMLEIEQRLRPCIELHRDMIEAMTVSVEETQQAFRQQVMDRLESLRSSSSKHKNSTTILTTMTESSTLGSIPMIEDPSVKKGEDSSKNGIKLVSLDIERTAVHNLLQQYHESQLLTEFFASIISSLDTDTNTNTVQERRKKDGDEEKSNNRYSSPDFITDTHVTMAFAGEQNSAETLLSTFHHLQGEEVRVTVTGFLWSLTHAALAITIASSTCKNEEDIVYFPIPTCENSFPHITVWCAPDTEAYHSNNLPDLVQSGKAYRVDFEEPHRQVLVGRFCFWNHDNVVITI